MWTAVSTLMVLHDAQLAFFCLKLASHTVLLVQNAVSGMCGGACCSYGWTLLA